MPPNPYDADEPLLQEENGRSRYVIFPVVHHDIYALAEKAEGLMWTTGEVDLSRDLDDWARLSPAHQHFLKTVLAFFAASDGIVMENLALRFMEEVKVPEARMFYGIQMGIETIHSKMYALLINAYVSDLGERNRLFQAIETMPCVGAKASWALRYIADKDIPFSQRLLAFACVEGLFFSSSFAAIYYFKTMGILPGLTHSNELISRDEGLHTDAAILMYRHHVKHHLPEAVVFQMVAEAVEVECAFVSDSLPEDLLGMNADLMQTYVRYMADRLLVSAGYGRLYNACNPFDFMDNISTETKVNFFEHRVSEYKKRVGQPVSNVQACNTFDDTEDF